MRKPTDWRKVVEGKTGMRMGQTGSGAPATRPVQEHESVFTAGAIVLALASTAPTAREAFIPCWADLLGRPVCAWAVDVLEVAQAIGEVVLLVPATRLDAASELVAASGWRKVRVAAAPPRTQQHPGALVDAALAALEPHTATIVFQDGARPLLAPELLEEALRHADCWGATAAATPARETIKWTDAARTVHLTPPRAHLWHLQTPIVLPRTALVAMLAASTGRAAPPGVPDSVIAWLARTTAEYPMRLVRADDTDMLVRRSTDLRVVTDVLRRRRAAGM